MVIRSQSSSSDRSSAAGSPRTAEKPKPAEDGTQTRTATSPAKAPEAPSKSKARSPSQSKARPLSKSKSKARSKSPVSKVSKSASRSKSRAGKRSHSRAGKRSQRSRSRGSRGPSKRSRSRRGSRRRSRSRRKSPRRGGSRRRSRSRRGGGRSGTGYGARRSRSRRGGSRRRSRSRRASRRSRSRRGGSRGKRYGRRSRSRRGGGGGGARRRSRSRSSRGRGRGRGRSSRGRGHGHDRSGGRRNRSASKGGRRNRSVSRGGRRRSRSASSGRRKNKSGSRAGGDRSASKSSSSGDDKSDKSVKSKAAKKGKKKKKALLSSDSDEESSSSAPPAPAEPEAPKESPEERRAKFSKFIDHQESLLLRNLSNAVKASSVKSSKAGMEEMANYLRMAIEQANGVAKRLEDNVIIGNIPKKLNPSKPTVLVVGNYDVPAYAKGNEYFLRDESDSVFGSGCITKGMLLCWLHAQHSFSYLDKESVPINLKFLFFGGDGGVENVIEQEKGDGELLDKVDLIVGMGSSWLDETPTLFLGARGATAFEVSLAVDRDDPALPLRHAGAIKQPVAELMDLVHAYQASFTVGEAFAVPLVPKSDERVTVPPPSLESYAKEVAGLKIKATTPEQALADRSLRGTFCLNDISTVGGGEGLEGNVLTTLSIPTKATIRFTVFSTDKKAGMSDLSEKVPLELKRMYKSKGGSYKLEARALQACSPWGITDADSPFVTKLRDAFAFVQQPAHVAVDCMPWPRLARVAQALHPVPCVGLPMCYAMPGPCDSLKKEHYLAATKLLCNFVDRLAA